MARIAIVCPPIPGHLNPIATLGRALRRRGHCVTVFQIPALGPSVRAAGLEFEPLGDVDGGLLGDRVRQMAELSGLKSLRFAVECSRQLTEMLCRHLPVALQTGGVDLVLADQNEPAAGSVAEHLRLPFISVCPSLPLNREANIPPPFVPWPYSATAAARIRNAAGMWISDRLIAPINRTLNRYRTEWRLPPVRTPDDSFSRVAQLCQMTSDFDFPRSHLAKGFHYLGPFCDNEGEKTPFPYERLNGKPLIYASLGTLQDAHSPYFQTIAEACSGLDAQLVISVGSRAVEIPDLPGSPVVVKYAPQLEILSRATLAITHAGLNTVMQSLMFGVPMIAIPITHDQPAIAARVARSGAGEAIPLGRITAERLRNAVNRVLREPGYRMRAESLRRSIELAGGVERAASIVEESLPDPCTG